MGRLTYYLPRRIGCAGAARILLTGQKLSAVAALDMGLATDVVAAGRALEESLRIAHEIAGMSFESTAKTYTLLRDSLDETLSHQLQEERRAQTSAIATADCREGIRAFFERRTPVFNRSAG